MTQCRKRKSYNESQMQVDTTKGQYLNFGMLCAEHGMQYNASTAIAAAYRWAQKCTQMGGKWVRFCKMSEELQYLFLRHEHVDQMVKAWTVHEEEGIQQGKSSRGSLEDVKEGDTAGDKQAAETLQALEDQEPKPKAKARRCSTKGEEQDEPKPKAKAKPTGGFDIEKQLKSATKLKTQYLAATSAANALVALVQGGGEEWQWARNEGNLGKLEAAIATLKGGMATFDTVFVASDTKEIKKRLGPEQLSDGLAKFLLLKSRIEDVDRARQRLLRRSAI